MSSDGIIRAYRRLQNQVTDLMDEYNHYRRWLRINRNGAILSMSALFGAIFAQPFLPTAVGVLAIVFSSVFTAYYTIASLVWVCMEMDTATDVKLKKARRAVSDYYAEYMNVIDGEVTQ